MMTYGDYFRQYFEEKQRLRKYKKERAFKRRINLIGLFLAWICRVILVIGITSLYVALVVSIMLYVHGI